MKIAFVMKSRQVAEPLGAMLLTSLLKARGHEVRLFFSSDLYWLRNLISFGPRIAAYSVLSGSQSATLNINRLIKASTSVFTLAGGPHATFFPEMIEAEGVDAVCVGEGEQAFLELVECLECGKDISGIRNLWVKDRGTIHRNPVRPLIQDLDGLPFPDREFIYGVDPYLRHSKIKRFLCSRGCPLQCTYCFNRSFKEIYRGERILRWRSAENLVEEIAQVKSVYPLELVRFVDDIFILPPVSWLEEFARFYRRRIQLPFVCNLQVKLVTEEKVRILKQAGCTAVYMAIEAGNDWIRNSLLDRKITKQEMMDAFDLVHRHGISIAAENILGLPGASLETDIETLELNTRCRVDNPIATLFQPYPKTKLGEYALREGYFHGNFELLEESYFGRSPILFASHREKRQIENLHRFFGFAVTHPRALPLIRHLIKLPPNRAFDLFHRLWDSFCKSRKIFKMKMGLRDYLSAFFRVMRY